MAIFRLYDWGLDLIVNYVFLQPISQKNLGIAWYLMCFLAHTHRHAVMTGRDMRRLGCPELNLRSQVACLTAACFFGKPFMEEVCFGH